MENKRERVMKPMDENAKTSRERVAEGGSSYCNLEKLIEDIKAMNLVGKASSGGEAIKDKVKRSCWGRFQWQWGH